MDDDPHGTATARDRHGVPFEERGAVALKGTDDQVRVFPVRPESRSIRVDRTHRRFAILPERPTPGASRAGVAQR